jgi:hypothetical protein
MNKIEFQLAEYEKLKDEQNKRIAFRDQMIYISLVAIGSVFSFAIESPRYYLAFLVLPFITLVLGWTYLVNDEKISAINKYIKTILIPKIHNIEPDQYIESWETYLTNDKKRRERKNIQLLVDLLIFCGSGITSIGLFFILKNDYSIMNIIFSLGIIIAIILLAIQFIRYSN